MQSANHANRKLCKLQTMQTANYANCKPCKLKFFTIYFFFQILILNCLTLYGSTFTPSDHLTSNPTIHTLFFLQLIFYIIYAFCGNIKLKRSLAAPSIRFTLTIGLQRCSLLIYFSTINNIKEILFIFYIRISQFDRFIFD